MTSHSPDAPSGSVSPYHANSKHGAFAQKSALAMKTRSTTCWRDLHRTHTCGAPETNESGGLPKPPQPPSSSSMGSSASSSSDVISEAVLKESANSFGVF